VRIQFTVSLVDRPFRVWLVSCCLKKISFLCHVRQIGGDDGLVCR